MGRYGSVADFTKVGRLKGDSVTWFDRHGQLRIAAGSGMTKFTAPSVQLGADDPGRIFTGNEQMNPLSRHVPSTVVSPQTTWNPALPQVNIAVAMIFAIVAAVNEVEDSISDSGSLLGRRKRVQNYQIIDFEEFLPEEIN